MREEGVRIRVIARLTCGKAEDHFGIRGLGKTAMEVYVMALIGITAGYNSARIGEHVIFYFFE